MKATSAYMLLTSLMMVLFVALAIVYLYKERKFLSGISCLIAMFAVAAVNIFIAAPRMYGYGRLPEEAQPIKKTPLREGHIYKVLSDALLNEKVLTSDHIYVVEDTSSHDHLCIHSEATLPVGKFTIIDEKPIAIQGE